jgi:folate-binding protein YgfZ
VVAGYGDPAAERAALAEGRALCDRTFGSLVGLAGADRARFANGLLTCDVRALAPGRATYGFLTSTQGKVLADVTVLALDDELWLDAAPGTAAAVAEHLGRYVIADRVEIARREETGCLALLGAAAGRTLGEAIEVGEHRALTLGGVALRAERRLWWGQDALLLWAPLAELPALWDHLLAAGRAAGLAAVGLDAVEAARIAAAAPRFGADFGPDALPQETGLEERAVSYSKGCYLGQEVVARLHYRGQANHGVYVLSPAAGPAPEAGTELSLDGRPVGSVTSAAGPPWLAEAHLLGRLHRRGAAAGTRLAWSGGEVEVVAPAGPGA